MEERRTRTSADTKLAPCHVLRLHVEGNTYEEISERLGRHVKSIDNALQRIKRKLRPHAQTLTEEVFAGVRVGTARLLRHAGLPRLERLPGWRWLPPVAYGGAQWLDVE